MPLIQVTLAKGRSPEQLRALGEALTAATEEAVGVHGDEPALQAARLLPGGELTTHHTARCLLRAVVDDRGPLRHRPRPRRELLRPAGGRKDDHGIAGARSP
jgi:hypothetical protein